MLYMKAATFSHRHGDGQFLVQLITKCKFLNKQNWSWIVFHRNWNLKAPTKALPQPKLQRSRLSLSPWQGLSYWWGWSTLPIQKWLHLVLNHSYYWFLCVCTPIVKLLWETINQFTVNPKNSCGGESNIIPSRRLLSVTSSQLVDAERPITKADCFRESRNQYLRLFLLKYT